MLFCTQEDQGGKTHRLKFGMLPSGCEDQGLRVQSFIVVHVCKSSAHVAQLRGWRMISQPLTTTPWLKLVSCRTAQRDTALLSLLGHFALGQPEEDCSLLNTVDNRLHSVGVRKEGTNRPCLV